MHPLRPRRSANFRTEVERAEKEKGSFHVGKLRPERVKNSTMISGGEERPESRGSESSKAGSQELIIRRDVHFDVTSHCAHGSRSLASRSSGN